MSQIENWIDDNIETLYYIHVVQQKKEGDRPSKGMVMKTLESSLGFERPQQNIEFIKKMDLKDKLIEHAQNYNK